jgi:murein DD-endopeptidase MepM/ murein hydrolase activator NlpD
MRFLQKYAFWLILLLFVAGLVSAPSPDMARTRLADGFDQPVGKPDGEGYYTSRGFRPRYHMGEDWNGIAGGNSDLGKPVYATANGIVVFARDMRMSWGNLVIIRHVYLEDSKLKMVDSVYAHLDKILIRDGQQVVRGQQVGTIGTAHGMYPAHLHFEIRKNLNIGFNQRAFPRDFTAYYAPSAFIGPHRKLAGAGRSAPVPINTFGSSPARSLVNDGSTESGSPVAPKATPTPTGQKPYKVKRFDDLWSF